mmetsp:Transcript_12262/g.51571  ORF Transcript_12262/g.51571 Transcript_12262/m.51571 type:complete len:348 (-) Transcript_12262:2248-3291(-)
MSAMSSLSLAGSARVRSNSAASSSTSKSRSSVAAPARAAVSDGNGAGDRPAPGTKHAVKLDSPKRGEAMRRDAISYPASPTAPERAKKRVPAKETESAPERAKRLIAREQETAPERAKRLIAQEADQLNSMVQLPSGERVTPWWRKGPNLRNIVDVRSADEFVAYLHEAANLDRKTGRARLVCVEYFAGWCHACRSVHPKLGKMAEKEFPDVLFLRVHKDDVPELCESLGVTKLPFVQLYKGVDGLVSQFPVSVTAPALARFRGELNQHRDGAVSLTDAHDGVSRLGVATTLHARGWPGPYTSAHKKLRHRALKYYRGKGGVEGDGLPPPGCPEEPPEGESAGVMSR